MKNAAQIYCESKIYLLALIVDSYPYFLLSVYMAMY